MNNWCLSDVVMKSIKLKKKSVVSELIKDERDGCQGSIRSDLG